MNKTEARNLGQQLRVLAEDVFKIVPRGAGMLARDPFGARALAGHDGVYQLAVLLLREAERAAEGGDLGAVGQEGRRRGEGQRAGPLDLAPDDLAAGQPGKLVMEGLVEV